MFDFVQWLLHIRTLFIYVDFNDFMYGVKNQHVMNYGTFNEIMWKTSKNFYNG
jgi:hypothetical protein